MKIIRNAQQGSEAWLQFRATRFGSSEAAAMLGLSPYTTRSELLRIKHTGLAREFSDWFQRNLLDNGHSVEAATRPMIEAQIDEELYPVVCEGEGRLATSCDGLTLDGTLVWECKQWNEALASEVRAGRVPDTHMPQCQHILMVTGAKRLRFTVSDGTGERLISCEVVPSPEWFERLRNGWAQFERDLAAYVPPAPAEPAPVGRSPETLPALRIEVTGAVTASNLAEFKATALAAIRSVNRDLKTDADFADADKAVKWCGEVEQRLKAAKEHALSQTADIDALFKALDDIGAEARAVRLDLDKLVKRRKDEVREQAVTAARRALDQHIAALHAELAPMRLPLVVADFAGAIKGLRSIASMQDALDTTLANAKIAADGGARVIRGNVAAFKAATGDDRALQALFADLGQLVHKAADDFAAVLDQRITKHRADEAERERKAAEARAAEIAAAEERAREQERARLAAEQRQREEAEAAAANPAPSFKPSPPVLQPGESYTENADGTYTLHSAQQAELIERGRDIVNDIIAAEIVRAAVAPAANEPATVKLGDLADTLGFALRADFIEQALGIKPAGRDRAAILYRPRQVPDIVSALQQHLARVQAGLSKAA